MLDAARNKLLDESLRTLIEPPSDAKAKTLPSDDQALSTQPPRLRALDWQDRVEACAGDSWLPSGEKLPSSDWLPPIAVIATARANDAGGTPRFLCLWFSHPLFDAQSIAQITLLDAESKNPLPVPTSDFASQMTPVTPKTGNTGWIVATLCAGKKGGIPPFATVSLRYSVGPWQFWDETAADYQGTKTLGNGVLLASPGQGADGHAFVETTRDRSVDPDNEQFDFVAITRDGRRLERGGDRLSGVGNALTERFSFDVPLSQVKSFECRKRPIRLFSSLIALKDDPQEDGKMSVDFDCQGETMQGVVARFQREYEVRLCFEDLDYDVKDAVTLGKALRDLGAKENAGTLRPGEKERLAAARRIKTQGKLSDETLFDVGVRYSECITANSVADFLVQLTRGTPYDFRQVGHTWVVLPRDESRLSFIVSLDATGLSVEQAAEAIVKQQPGQNPIATGLIISGPQLPGTDPTPWLSVRLPSLGLKAVPALDALCRITEMAYPRSVWSMGGYKNARMLSIFRAPGPVEQTIQTAQFWLHGLDDGDYDRNWNNADDAMKTGASRTDWQTAVDSARRPHGAVQSRSLRQVTDEASLPHGPAGLCRIMRFNTIFSRDRATETVVVRQGLDGVWRVASYSIQ